MSYEKFILYRIFSDEYSGGRHAEATHILAQISGKNLPTDDPAVVSLKKDIDDAITLELADGPWKFTECFKSGPLKVRRRFLLAIGTSPALAVWHALMLMILLFRPSGDAAAQWNQCACILCPPYIDYRYWHGLQAITTCWCRLGSDILGIFLYRDLFP